MNPTGLRPDPIALGEEWKTLVEAEYEQVERLREWHEDDYYRPVAQNFIEDPRRTDDEILNVLLASTSPETSWVDIGAGAGRYALPLALHAKEVFAVEPSPSMRDVLKRGIAEHGLDNVRIISERWPEGAETIEADNALASHVTYDIRAINSFLDGLEQACQTRCFIFIMDQAPSSNYLDLWRAVHNENRVQLPAMRETLHLLLARGSYPEVRLFTRSLHGMTPEEHRSHARRRLWLREGSPKDRKLQALLDDALSKGQIDTQSAGRIAMISWGPDSVAK